MRLVPVLFGAGTHMFDHLGPDHHQLEAVAAVNAAALREGAW